MLESEVHDLLERVATTFDKAGVDYADARFDSTKSTGISKDKAEENISYGASEGFHLRVLKGGEWRAISLAGVDKKEIVTAAVNLSKFTPTTKAKSSYKPLKTWALDEEPRVRKKFSDVGLDEKTELVRDLFGSLMDDKRIVNATVGYREGIDTKAFVNTEGSKLRTRTPVVRFILVAYAKAGKNIQVDLHVDGKYGVGYEFIEGINFDESCKETAKGAIALLDAEQAPSGKLPVVLDPDMTGLIAHESFGHGLEADQVLRNRSFLSEKLNKKVASENVTIVDNSAYENAYGTYAFDDEGVKSKRNVLVENGILRGFLHSRETASALKTSPTGNGRAQNFSRKIYVRMSNTYFEKGDWELEEMLEDIDHGVYLEKSSHGMEDPLGGGIQVSSVKGNLIEHGKLTKLLRPASLSGNVLELLQNVDAVGGDFKLHPGSCGKGYEDWVRVSSGGPSMRVKEAIVSGG
ncbi:MAG: TldD/PmbA family protein [Candidatus Bathyarchaeia archaeon]